MARRGASGASQLLLCTLLAACTHGIQHGRSTESVSGIASTNSVLTGTNANARREALALGASAPGRARCSMQPVFSGPYGADASQNLTRYLTLDLFRRLHPLFAKDAQQPEGLERFDAFPPIVSCPPASPLKRYGSDGDGGKELCSLHSLSGLSSMRQTLGSRSGANSGGTTSGSGSVRALSASASSSRSGRALHAEAAQPEAAAAMTPAAAPSSSAPPGACVIFSLGSRGDFEFEQAMLKQTSCVVHTFDCTYDNKGKTLDKERHVYHPVCLGTTSDAKMKSKFKTFLQVVEEMGHPTISILKVDIEGYEYQALADLAEMHVMPQQISMELHYSGKIIAKPPYLKHGPQNARDLALFFYHLGSLGYAAFTREDNLPSAKRGAPCCSEYSFLHVQRRVCGGGGGGGSGALALPHARHNH